MRSETRFSEEGEIKLKSTQITRSPFKGSSANQMRKHLKNWEKCMTHSTYSINCDYNYIVTKIVAMKMQKKPQIWERLIM